ncbi:MAG: Plasma membrane low glucose sensor [Watsoniomyces obsoletus]|nr:MAG: Plasma membrane low glucose sensor [Watsoniomyces obsoletus]
MSANARTPTAPQGHLLHRLLQQPLNGSADQSLLDYALTNYADPEELARLSQTSWEMVEPSYAVIWREVEIMMDSVWATTNNRPGQTKRFAQWHHSVRELVVSGRWDAAWTRTIMVVEDFNPDRYPARDGEDLDPVALSDAYIPILDFIAQTTHLTRFEWHCIRLPPPTPLLPILGTKSATLDRVVVRLDGDAYQVNNLTVDEHGNAARATEAVMTFDILTEHAIWGPTAMASVEHLRLNIPHFRITLECADEESTIKLLRLLDQRVTRVFMLRIKGYRRHDMAVLPPLGTRETTVKMKDFLINWRRNIPVSYLYCEFLSTELRLIGHALHTPALTDLYLRNCTRMPDLLEHIVRDAPSLRAFGYYGILHTDDLEQLNRGDHKESFQQLERWDLLGVLDFARQVQAPLEVLDLQGAFSDANLVPYREHVFAAVQAHLPTLRQLFILDGDDTEFTRLDLVEMAACSTRLHDLRIRAVPSHRDSDMYGLMDHLPDVLARFPHLLCFLFLSHQPKSEQEHEPEYRKAIDTMLEVAEYTPLRFMGYEELQILEMPDMPDADVPRPPPMTVARFHRIYQPDDADFGYPRLVPTLSNMFEVREFEPSATRGIFSSLAADFGIPQRHVKVKPWPRRELPGTPSIGDQEMADLADIFGDTDITDEMDEDDDNDTVTG